MHDRIIEAIESGHKASQILKDVIYDVADFSCPKAYGFEGSDTYSDCESDTCIVCVSKKIKQKLTAP